MQSRNSRAALKWLGALSVALCGAVLAQDAQGASFGINFGGNNGGWGPYYMNSANGTSTHDAGPYESAFGVAAADWYEPGPVANTAQLPGAPASVPFSPASMGSGGVDIAFEAAHPPSGVQDGYTWTAFGFANANQFGPWEEDGEGNRLVEHVEATDWHNGFDEWILAEDAVALPENGRPESGEHAVLAGFIFAVNASEGWDTRDIFVTISGMNSIASEYQVTVLASAQNGGGNVGYAVNGFTPAVIEDNAGNTDLIDFELLEERPDFWSPAQASPEDNPYVSVGGQGTSTTTFTGDEITIRLSGWNEYTNFDDAFNLWRTTLAGVVIEYESIVTPEGLDGDFNNDGVVDAADYTVWRNNLGGEEGVLAGNGGVSGVVDEEDYLIWKGNFGETAAASLQLGSGGQVPEPSSGVLLLLAVCGLLYVARPYVFAANSA